jgi:hypothetical protein
MSHPNPPNADFDAAVRLLRAPAAGGPAQSLRLLRQASAAGCAQADDLLAVMFGMGVGGPQNWVAALDHLELAARRGSAGARGQLAALGDLARPANLGAWLTPPAKTVLSASPRVVAVAGFVPRPVCDWLIGCAAGRTRAAMVYGGGAAGEVVRSRSNTAFEFGFFDLDLVIVLVRARIAATIGVPVAILENPQILHYDVGEAFARHHDYLDPSRPGHAAEIEAGGQRIITFLVYLNDAYEGGQTDFPLIALRHRGGLGDGLYFGNVDPGGKADPRTLHAGLAPTQGEKWLLSQWVRDRSRQ